MQTITADTLGVKPMTITGLKYFIEQNNLSNNDSILVDENVFDELAEGYRYEYHESISIPFIFLGVWIRIDDRSNGRLRAPKIVRNDPRPDEEPAKFIPIRDMAPEHSEEPVHRCWNCGKLIQENGSYLTGEAFAIAADSWELYGDSIIVKSMCNNCKASPNE